MNPHLTKSKLTLSGNLNFYEFRDTELKCENVEFTIRRFHCNYKLYFWILGVNEN